MHDTETDPGRRPSTAPSRRSVVRAGAWAAPAVIIAAAAPPAAAASPGFPLSFGLTLGANCAISKDADGHVNAAFTEGILITVSGGQPGTPVGQIRLAATYAPAPGEPPSTLLTASNISPPSFPYAPGITVGNTYPRIEWVYSQSGSLVFDGSGNAVIDVQGEQLRLENATPNQSGTFTVMAYEVTDPTNFASVTQFAFGG